MTITTLGIAHIQPIVSLIAGILILIMPQLLNYIVASRRGIIPFSRRSITDLLLSAILMPISR